MSTLPERLQAFDAGRMVTLYEIDMSDIATIPDTTEITVFRFTHTTDDEVDIPSIAIQYDGNNYVPIQVEATGFEWTSQGQLPQPHVRISAVGLAAAVISALDTFDDLVGAKFTRIRTFERYLDNGSEPDTTQIYPKEIYRIARKTNQSRDILEFDLQSSFDQQGTMLPRRDALRDSCTHPYRTFDAQIAIDRPDDPFDYTGVTCPYASLPSFDINGDPIAPSGDVCSKRLGTGCEKRFQPLIDAGLRDNIPIQAFPAIGRTR